MAVYFVGAGPGDPELLTIKGKELLERADVIVYAGSLINPQVLQWARPGAKIYDSSGLTLEEGLAIILEAEEQGLLSVRLHTGDPSLYGALQEQLEALRKHGVACKIVPGVSSFLAAAASLGAELTVPGGSQTVILTRVEGRTAVPGLEDLSSLARHRSTLCLFLSAGLLEKASAQLLSAYPPETPAALVYKASWPEERVVLTKLSCLVEAAAREGLNRTALLMVGDFLGERKERSRLYHPEFRHGYRA